MNYKFDILYNVKQRSIIRALVLGARNGHKESFVDGKNVTSRELSNEQ